MNILLLGKTGLLGQALYAQLAKEHAVVSPSHEECDVTNAAQVRTVIEKNKPDIVINATGYTQVDAAEKDQASAFALNTDAVKNLVSALKKTKIPLVHFSTDYVFNGKNENGYDETAAVSPLSVYGASKAAGEAEIIKNLKNYYLIRTSWLFGSGGKNFVDAMLFLAERGEPPRVVYDQIGNPTYTIDLAQAVSRLLQGSQYGMYHIVNEGEVSWYEFAQEIFKQLGIPVEIIPITTKELNRPAPRPHYSILRNTKLSKLRHWKEALTDYLQAKTLII